MPYDPSQPIDGPNNRAYHRAVWIFIALTIIGGAIALAVTA